MEIKIENLNKLVAKADEIFLSPKGEETLVELLKIQEQVEAAIDEVKATLEAAATKLNPSFNSIQGDKIKVSYRYFGSKYYLDESKIAEIEKDMYKTHVKYSVDTKAVESFLEAHKALPDGINEVERKKQITFSLKGDAKNAK